MRLHNQFTAEEVASYALIGGAVLRRQARKHGLGSGQLHTLMCLYMLTNGQCNRYLETSALARAVDVAISLFRAHVRDLLRVDLIHRDSPVLREARHLRITEEGQLVARSCLLAIARRAHVFQKLNL